MGNVFPLTSGASDSASAPSEATTSVAPSNTNANTKIDNRKEQSPAEKSLVQDMLSVAGASSSETQELSSLPQCWLTDMHRITEAYEAEKVRIQKDLAARIQTQSLLAPTFWQAIAQRQDIAVTGSFPLALAFGIDGRDANWKDQDIDIFVSHKFLEPTSKDRFSNDATKTPEEVAAHLWELLKMSHVAPLILPLPIEPNKDNKDSKDVKDNLTTAAYRTYHHPVTKKKITVEVQPKVQPKMAPKVAPQVVTPKVEPLPQGTSTSAATASLSTPVLKENSDSKEPMLQLLVDLHDILHPRKNPKTIKTIEPVNKEYQNNPGTRHILLSEKRIHTLSSRVINIVVVNLQNLPTMAQYISHPIHGFDLSCCMISTNGVNCTIPYSDLLMFRAAYVRKGALASRLEKYKRRKFTIIENIL